MDEKTETIVSSIPIENVMKNLTEITSQVRDKLNILNDLKKKIDEEREMIKQEVIISPVPEESNSLPEVIDPLPEEYSDNPLDELRKVTEILDIISVIEARTIKASTAEVADKIKKKISQFLDR